MTAPTSSRPISPLKGWLAEFLLMRDLYKGPNGRPLYSYQVTPQEYENLRKAPGVRIVVAPTEFESKRFGGVKEV